MIEEESRGIWRVSYVKIVDESILFYSRVSLSKFSLEALFHLWVWGVFILGWEKNVKLQVFQNRGGSRLDLVARSSHAITKRPVVLFCLVVLQLAWRFNFWHAWHVCYFWRLEAASHPRDQVASLCFLTHSWAFQHFISLTTLTTIPPKYRVTKCWITSKFGTE